MTLSASAQSSTAQRALGVLHVTRDLLLLVAREHLAERARLPQEAHDLHARSSYIQILVDIREQYVRLDRLTIHCSLLT